MNHMLFPFKTGVKWGLGTYPSPSNVAIIGATTYIFSTCRRHAAQESSERRSMLSEAIWPAEHDVSPSFLDGNRREIRDFS